MSMPIRLPILAVLSGLALAGCGPEMVWRKPGASSQDFNTTSYRCQRESAAAAPVDRRATSVTSDSRRERGRRGTYSSTERDIRYTDVNADDRSRFYAACMRAAGWRLEPVTGPPPPAPRPQAGVPAPTVGAPAACREGARLFAFSDGAWYAGRALGSRGGGCLVRFDGFDADEDEVVPSGALLPYASEGPGRAVSQCRRGDAVIAYSEEAWFPGRVREDGRNNRCPIRFDGFGPEEDEDIPLHLVRRF
ncbi:MAG: hypothetical protein EAZ99_09020 [Alphaproteobacteria bacterium]|nr:MAG: hypothetical protein EAZ99_09020 [Alphaproteobacteria bacterium]